MTTYIPYDDITIEDYTEKSFVIRGSTEQYKKDIKTLGGKWNPRLRDGPGWIFPITKKDIVTKWRNTGESLIRPEDTELVTPRAVKKVVKKVEQKTDNTSVQSTEINNILDRHCDRMIGIIETRFDTLQKKFDEMQDIIKQISLKLEIDTSNQSSIIDSDTDESSSSQEVMTERTYVRLLR